MVLARFCPPGLCHPSILGWGSRTEKKTVLFACFAKDRGLFQSMSSTVVLLGAQSQDKKAESKSTSQCVTV